MVLKSPKEKQPHSLDISPLEAFVSGKHSPDQVETGFQGRALEWLEEASLG